MILALTIFGIVFLVFMLSMIILVSVNVIQSQICINKKSNKTSKFGNVL